MISLCVYWVFETFVGYPFRYWYELLSMGYSWRWSLGFIDIIWKELWSLNLAFMDLTVFWTFSIPADIELKIILMGYRSILSLDVVDLYFFFFFRELWTLYIANNATKREPFVSLASQWYIVSFNPWNGTPDF